MAIEGANLAVLSGLDKVFDVSELTFSVSLVGESTDFLGFVPGLYGGADIGGCGGQGLFAEDVVPGRKSRDNLVFVRCVGAGDDDGVALAGFEEGVFVVEGGCLVEIGESALEAGDLRRVGIGEGRDLAVGAVEEALGVNPHDSAASDESNSDDFLHSATFTARS